MASTLSARSGSSRQARAQEKSSAENAAQPIDKSRFGRENPRKSNPHKQGSSQRNGDGPRKPKRIDRTISRPAAVGSRWGKQLRNRGFGAADRRGFEDVSGNSSPNFFLSDGEGNLTGWTTSSNADSNNVLFASPTGVAIRHDGAQFGLWSSAGVIPSPDGGNFVAFDGDPGRP
jgi:hypothetical protein